MTRALPRRRTRGRGATGRDSGPTHRAAYVEADDQDFVPRSTGATTARTDGASASPGPPVVAGRVTSSDPVGSVASTRRTPPGDAPGNALDPPLGSGTRRVEVAAPEAPDPDLPALSAATEISLQVRRRPRGFAERHRRLLTAPCVGVVLVGLGLLVAALVGTGPAYLDDVGSVVVIGGFTWALAARTGGRPVIFTLVAVVAAVLLLVSGQAYLRTGAAVMTCVLAATLAVVATVPATRFVRVVQEALLAVVIASVGALATLGLAPQISLVRFEYVTLALSLLGSFGVVYRLGAGFHGLGRRGVVVVLGGGVVLLMTLIYAEALRRYGPPGLVVHLLDMVRWSRGHLGAFPRPLEAVLGIPALVWGIHMRARRRQGWWVCAFGAAGTAAVANSLLNPAITFRECGLSVLYGLVVGVALGYVVIRIDLALGGTGTGGRRSEEHAAARPEPPRTASLI